MLIEKKPGTTIKPMQIATSNNSPTLRSLAANRRLVAPSGKKTAEGQMLGPVDESTASSLLAQGKSVYAVSGNTVDEGFTRRISASNGPQTTGYIQDEAFVKRTYTYQLKSLAEEGALRALPSGHGLPPGLTGVLLEANSCSRVISSDTQVGDVRISSNQQSLSFAQNGFSGDPNISLDARRVEGGIVSSINIRDPIMLAGAALGIGIAVANGAAPVVSLAGLLIGGVAGRELGTIAQQHMPAVSRRSF